MNTLNIKNTVELASPVMAVMAEAFADYFEDNLESFPTAWKAARGANPVPTAWARADIIRNYLNAIDVNANEDYLIISVQTKPIVYILINEEADRVLSYGDIIPALNNKPDPTDYIGNVLNNLPKSMRWG